ncbi:hypothetical protein SDC9_183995 [bioreactor metagenome]|uniref:Uncharacterized protein n=1 Tax=bioreactor metagenome TaxID=1076179 RepID=A0A645HD82_9ZZZZ
MGEYKWKNLNLAYQLTDTPEPTFEELKAAHQIFISAGLPLIIPASLNLHSDSETL